MKISIFTTVFYPHHSKFGISNIAYLLARNMTERHGSDITVYSVSVDGQNLSDISCGMEVKRFRNEIKSFNFSHRMLLCKKNRADIVHSFHYGYFPATAGFISAKKMGIPHVFTPAYHPPIYTSPKKVLSWCYNISQGVHILKHSEKVLVFNNSEKEALQRHVEGRYEVSSCPVDRKIFCRARKEAGKIRIGFIGPMLPWKGAGIAADIFSEIQKERDDVEFVFIGFGHLEKEIRKKGKFRFHKDLSAEKIAEHMNSMDILVAPTKYESFGYILAEAGMCGTPVISTNVGAVPETVGPGGILVNYGDWNGMRRQIEYLIDDGRKRKSLGKKAVKHTSRFRDDVVSEKIYRVYKSVAL
ncbi:MAG: glycosyltransferase family 4 protein [Candidatus Aenigmarchaeota archaeon]|nr:glycosyltransferase family 4 protein [Candidatus Aenigmarchaeota archaeon]